MESLFLSTTIERTADKRLHVSWARKNIPLKSSMLFSKAKHSEEWHYSIDASAGILHPSDPTFPYIFLHQHTDAYLKKKGKVSQTDIDARLLNLINAHEARHVAIAAAAPFMTAGSPALRALLQVDLNVMQGSYWGLETWLQCLIAANHGNPASVTDLEALWARRLLPFAMHGACAAGRYLEGVCKVLGEYSTPNMGSVPEFVVLTKRALMDFGLNLKGMRLRCQWTAAYAAVAWLKELTKSEPALTTSGRLSPTQLLDSQFPAWRLWVNWRPHTKRIASLAGMSSTKLNAIMDLAALEGPDILTGSCHTLREGLVAQYATAKSYVKYEGLVIEVLDHTKDELRNKLEGMAGALDIVTARAGSDTTQDGMFNLFTTLIVNQPVTKEALDLFEATCRVPYAPENDIYNAVCEIYTERNGIGGQNFAALQHLVCGLADPSAERLRTILLQPWLARGLQSCISECRTVVRLCIEQKRDWTPLALEFLEFYVAVRKFKETFWQSEAGSEIDAKSLPSMELFKTVIEIYRSAQKEPPRQPNMSKKPATKQSNQDGSTDCTELALKTTDTARHPLEEIIEEYWLYTFEKSSALSNASQHVLDVMLKIWTPASGPVVDTDRRSLALHMTESLSSAYDLLSKCLLDIASPRDSIPQGSFYKDTLSLMRWVESEPSEAIVAFTRLLVKRKPSSQCWRDVLYRWLQAEKAIGNPSQKNVLQYSLQTMKFSEWLSFMNDLETLFTDFPYPKSYQDGGSMPIPTILQRRLLNWKTQITEYEGTIKRLETHLGDDLNAVRCLLAGEEVLWTKNLVSILESLRRAEGKPEEVLIQSVVGKLSVTTKNGWQIADCVHEITIASHEAVEACRKIWDAKHGVLNLPGWGDESRSKQQQSGSSKLGTLRKMVSARRGSSAKSDALSKSCTSESKSSQTATQQRSIPLSVVEVMVAGYVQSGAFDSDDVGLIQSMADVLNIERYDVGIPRQKLQEATEFWAGIEKEMIEEEERLEGLQRALKKKDPRGTAALLNQLGLPGDSVLDIELSELPAGVIDVVEKVSDGVVEIGFSLASYTDLQRQAMGIPNTANMLLLRLYIDESGEELPSFCVHYDNEPTLSDITHFPWSCAQDSSAPDAPICRSIETAYTWQLNRVLHRQLTTGSTTIVDLHSLVKKHMSLPGQSCISCGTSHNASNAHLRRSTPCDLVSCTNLWYLLPLHVRIPEIRSDPFAVDLLLSTVYAAALSGRSELLPACPIRSTEAVKTILDALPTLPIMRDAVNLSLVLRTYHPDAEKLISWACVHFRGYLTTATGACKVPNLPQGTHQFVLAGARPALESAFASSLAASGPRHGPESTVLFHGTTPDRLPAILAQGLKSCSGTALQRTGAVYGNGIYLAEDPATSFSYSAAAVSWRNSGLHNTKMLLGCEVVGSAKIVSTGIRIVTDEKAVMVRYVFLFSGNQVPPISGHMVPAMASAMRGLRMGTL